MLENLNADGAFSEAFEPERAPDLASRTRLCGTPKRDSWLNVAERELCALSQEFLNGCRVRPLGALQADIGA